MRYVDGRGLLRDVLGVLTGSGFAVTDLSTPRVDDDIERTPTVDVSVHLEGRGDLDATVVSLTELDGVLAVTTGSREE